MRGARTILACWSNCVAIGGKPGTFTMMRSVHSITFRIPPSRNGGWLKRIWHGSKARDESGNGTQEAQAKHKKHNFVLLVFSFVRLVFRSCSRVFPGLGRT